MKSLGFALRGIMHTLKTERNFRIQLCFAFYVILTGFVCRLSSAEWAAVLGCIGLVLGLESVNTAIERLCDTVTCSYHPGIKLAKDTAAGAVLLAALAAAAVGGVIFLTPEKLAAARRVLERPGLLALIILPLVPLGLFVRGGRRKQT